MELFEQILVIPITGYIVGMKCSNFVNFSKSSAKIKVQCTAFWNAQYIDYSHLNTTIVVYTANILLTGKDFEIFEQKYAGSVWDCITNVDRINFLWHVSCVFVCMCLWFCWNISGILRHWCDVQRLKCIYIMLNHLDGLLKIAHKVSTKRYHL